MPLFNRLKSAITAFRFPQGENQRYARGWDAHGTNFTLNLNVDREDINNAIEKLDPLTNSAVMACLAWMMDVWPEAPMRVYSEGDSGQPEWEPFPSKKADIVAFQRMMRRPNSDYGALPLWQASVLSLMLDGNSYWYKLRNGRSVVGLQYVPHHLIEPDWPKDGSQFISRYVYSSAGGTYELKPEDVVHFRQGLDPRNIRKGLSRFKAALLDVFTDQQSAIYAASMLYKMGVGTWVIQPDTSLITSGAIKPIEKEDAEAIKDKFGRATKAINKDSMVVNSIPLKFDKLSFSPSEVNARESRMTPEERICAVFRIPPGVVKLGAGLERNTYSNAETEQEQAYRNAVLPMHRVFKDGLDASLLPEFTVDENWQTGFDVSDINALQEDEDARAKRFALLWTSDLIKRSEARSEMGYDADSKSDEVYRSEWVRIANPMPDPTAPMLPEPGKKGKEFKKDSVLTLEQAAQNFRKALISKDEAVIAELGALLSMVEEALVKRLNELARRIDDAQAAGEEVSEGWLKGEAKYLALINQINDEMEEFGITATTRTTEQQREFVNLASFYAERMTTIAADEAGLNISFNRLPIRQLESFAGFASDGSPLSALFAELGPDMAQKAKEAIFEHIALGKGSQDLARALDPVLGGNRNRALTIARTEPHRAAREATRQTYLQNSDIMTGWIWMSASDSRTCAACFAMHGTKHDSSDTLDGHPQCRCVMVPNLTDAPLSMASGKEKFSDLSDEEQEQILGSQLFDLYRSGKVGFDDLVTQTHDARWGSMRRPATVDEALASAAARRMPKAS
jgi:HK97 family phage portal protein